MILISSGGTQHRDPETVTSTQLGEDYHLPVLLMLKATLTQVLVWNGIACDSFHVSKSI